MSKLKSDVERIVAKKIEHIAEILDNPHLLPQTKFLQLVHDAQVERSIAKKLAYANEPKQVNQL